MRIKSIKSIKAYKAQKAQKAAFTHIFYAPKKA